jgi:PqqD family protein of HPr-rel-A system
LIETIWERKNCVSAELDDTLVLLDLESLAYHSLNKTAAATWEILAEPQTEDSIVEALCRRFDVTPERCRVSLLSLLHTLANKGLIQRAGVPSDPSA